MNVSQLSLCCSCSFWPGSGWFQLRLSALVKPCSADQNNNQANSKHNLLYILNKEVIIGTLLSPHSWCELKGLDHVKVDLRALCRRLRCWVGFLVLCPLVCYLLWSFPSLHASTIHFIPMYIFWGRQLKSEQFLKFSIIMPFTTMWLGIWKSRYVCA